MNNLGRYALILAGIVVLLVVGVFAYIYVSGGSGEPSEEIIAPTLPPREEATEEVVAAEPTEAMTEEVAMVEPTAIMTEEAVVATEEPTAVPEVAPAGAPAAAVQTFAIVKEESLVRFRLEEDLRGIRTTVVGETNEVAGFIEIDPTTPANSRIGTIRVNMRTLATDNDFRNRAIRSQILETANDDYEFSDFIPTSVTGLPESVNVGEPFSFTVVGTLDIKGQPHDVTFEMDVTPVSETRIEGFGTAIVLYPALGLSIPNAPGVANVTEEVTLEIEFVAVATES